MSRTLKDTPRKYSDKEYDFYKRHTIVEHTVYSNSTGLEYTYVKYIEKAGTKCKKKRHQVEKNWMRTPMWWIHEMMTVPQRAKNSIWEKNVVKLGVEDLEDTDPPCFGRKPHIYYW